MRLENRIGFVGVIVVKNANSNGDPLTGNLPRTDRDGIGEISDVCLKNKIRRAACYKGVPIFVQEQDLPVSDDYKSMKARALGNEEFKKACDEKNQEKAKEIACRTWFDVRAFGQVLPYAGKKTAENENLSIYGPVSITLAKSTFPVTVENIQITKSTHSSSKDSASDTFGSTSVVDFGIYLFKGDINANLAEKTGFSKEDAEVLKQAILHMFDYDSAAARPGGSVWLEKLFWFNHRCKNGNVSVKKIHDSIKVIPKKSPRYGYRDVDDYDIICEALDGIDIEVYEDL